MEKHIKIKLYRGTSEETRKHLFQEALTHAKYEKVLFILKEQLNELPELSQDLTTSRNCMKMMSFLYAQSLECLMESLSTLPAWQQVPTTLILDSLHNYCDKDNIQNACAVVALLIDSARSCSISTNIKCNVIFSIDNGLVGDHYCNLVTELYSAELK